MGLEFLSRAPDLRIRAPKTKFGEDVALDPKLSVTRKVAGALDPRLPPPGTYLARSIDCIVVYKVDRLSRSLLDFARIIEVFDRNAVSFVAVTQQFNTTSSLGRLTLNILLSFAQFEREIISERTRDKMSAARRKGISSNAVWGQHCTSAGQYARGPK